MKKAGGDAPGFLISNQSKNDQPTISVSENQ